MANFIEKVHESFLQDRVLVLNDEINIDLVERTILPIIKWNMEDAGKPENLRKPITIYLNTPGGNVSDGFVLCNVIETSKTPIDVIVLGLAASMGGYIAMSAKKGHRKCYAFSTFLLHPGSMVVGGNSDAVESTVEYYKNTKKDIQDFVVSHTEITDDLYKEHQRDEWYMDAKTAKGLGIVDYIIGVDGE